MIVRIHNDTRRAHRYRFKRIDADGSALLWGPMVARDGGFVDTSRAKFRNVDPDRIVEVGE